MSVADDDAAADGMPPSVAITLSPKTIAISETVQLPLRSHPIHYPFDRYQMVIAIDLALSMVIIFVLGALAIRALLFVHDEAQMQVLRRHRRPTSDARPPKTP